MSVKIRVKPRRRRAEPVRCIVRGMRFYEIREADEELGLGVTLAHEETFTPAEFLALVEAARSRIIESFAEETLVEAIAQELEEHHGFAAALDHALVAAVAVSTEEGETALIVGPAGEEEHVSSDEDGESDPDLLLAEALLAGEHPSGLRTALIDLDAGDDVVDARER